SRQVSSVKRWFFSLALLLSLLGEPMPGARVLLAQEPKKVEAKQPLLQVQNRLADTDPLDKKLKHFCKTHPVKLAAGKVYQIDLKSTDFDAFLRLESADGKELAYDDDSGGGSTGQDARIVYAAKQDGDYRIIA